LYIVVFHALVKRMGEQAEDLSAEGFDKDVEIQSIHSSSQSSNHDRGVGVGRDGDVGKGSRSREMEKGDIEGVNEFQNELGAGKVKEKGKVTRTSTRGSWKDPGPPPDGGWTGWTQGV
jgi:hypothetical protein